MTAMSRPYRYLNRDGLWPGFTWEGLELDGDGVLRLMALPRLDGEVPSEVGLLDAAQPAAGIAVDEDGTVYFSDPSAHAVYRLDACTGMVTLAPCLGTAGTEPTQLLQPAGLLIPPHRRALYVADSGNGRIQIFDLETMALAEIIGGFERPVSLACDDEGELYVVDTGANRVDRITLAGEVVSSFWSNVQSSGQVTQPVAVSCDGAVVFVLDGMTHQVSLFDCRGVWIRSTEVGVAHASVLATYGGTIYLNDPDRRRVAVLRGNQTGSYVRAGDAAGYEGPAAALCCDSRGRLLVLPGGSIGPLTFLADGSHRPEGWLHSGPVAVDGIAHYWNRLHADVALPEGAHIQFFIHAGDVSSPPPPASSDPVSSDWRAAGSATDIFLTFDGTKAQALWIAARFSTDHHVTPALSQVRVDFDQQGYLEHLPAIFRERDCDETLLRYLSLFESFFSELEQKIERLPEVVDPDGADVRSLAWLAGFLALPLPEVWSERERRDAIASAYERYARRGTVAGLIDALRSEAGVRATIDEPIQSAGWWTMPGVATGCTAAARQQTGSDGGMLGINTVLASAEPQGAVVGTTATLDGSHLIAQEEFGMPLFDAVAYRFTVQLFPGDAACQNTVDQVKAVIDREKPAHTAYQLCVLEPGIRVGYRARLGIDTLLGHGAAAGRLGETDLVLGGDPPSQLGVRSHLGVSTHL
jgi:phage tail-like protein